MPWSCFYVVYAALAALPNPGSGPAAGANHGRLNPAVWAPVAQAANGMDLLYDNRVHVLPRGEPQVKVGIAMGVDGAQVRGQSNLHVRYVEDGVPRHAVLPPHVPLTIQLVSARVAARQSYVDLGVLSEPTPAKIAQGLALWRERGVRQVVPLYGGLLLSAADHRIDTREVRLTLPAKDRASAELLAVQLSRGHSGNFSVLDYLATRPSGTLQVVSEGSKLGQAHDYVHLSAEEGAVEVDNVEFGRGYPWHGRETRAYHGDVYATVDPNGTMALVNVLGVENILLGVVPAEIFPSAPTEALKAQAVAARNTLLFTLGRRHQDTPFHICSEQHCQVYTGATREDMRTTAAVLDTAGEALFFQSKLVNAVYSASCGGFTEDNDAVWVESANQALRARPDFELGDPDMGPYNQGITLANAAAFIRLAPMTFCARPTIARPDKLRWQKTYDKATLQTFLTPRYSHLGRLRDISVLERGRGGRVKALALTGDRGVGVARGELAIRQLFGNLNSAVFYTQSQRDGDGFVAAMTFYGAGWGHGVGMCQMGAIGRAQSGSSYDSILAYYYNGARMTRLWHDTPMAQTATIP